MIKRLSILLSILVVLFIVLWIITANIGPNEKENTSSTVSITFQTGDVQPASSSQNTVPKNYLPVSGYENVYQVINEQTKKVVGYKERLANGQYIDFDISIPNNYKKSAGSDTVYKVLTADGKIYQYRKFNGKEWDIVDKDGKIIFAIPKNYTRIDLKSDLYQVKTGKKVVRKQIVRFADGSYAWQNAN